MCGIAAYSGKEPFDPIKMKLLLLYNETRGEDSCGYYNEVDEIPFGDGRINRHLGKVSESLLTYDFTPTKVFVGHTRKSTSPSTTRDVKYAHPFQFDNIIGVHNGSFTNWDKIVERFLEDDEEGTKEYLGLDSRLLYYWIQKKQNFDILKYIDGGTALVYVDENKPGQLTCLRNDITGSKGVDTVNIARNTRPLFRGNMRNEEGEVTGMYISSIEDSLKAIGCVDIKEFADNRVYTISEGKIEGNGTKLPAHVGYDYAEHNAWKREKEEAKKALERIEEQKAVIESLPSSVKNTKMELDDLVKVKGTYRTIIGRNTKISVKKEAFKYIYYSDGTVSCRNEQYYTEREVVLEEVFYNKELKCNILVQFLSCGGFNQFRLDNISQLPVSNSENTNGEERISISQDIQDKITVLNYEVFSKISDHLGKLRTIMNTHGVEDLRSHIEDMDNINAELLSVYDFFYAESQVNAD